MARSWRSQIADEVRSTSLMKPRPMTDEASTLKLTKAQRLKMVTPEDRATIADMPDEYLLALHDFIHLQMEIRSGSNKRSIAGKALEKP